MKFDKNDLLLYAVADRAWLNNQTLYEQVEQALMGGATFIQLREKNLDEEYLIKQAMELKELCKRYQIPFVINDSVTIAHQIQADGVHVGQKDMEISEVRTIMGPDKIWIGYN